MCKLTKFIYRSGKESYCTYLVVHMHFKVLYSTITNPAMCGRCSLPSFYQHPKSSRVFFIYFFFKNKPQNQPLIEKIKRFIFEQQAVNSELNVFFFFLLNTRGLFCWWIIHQEIIKRLNNVCYRAEFWWWLMKWSCSTGVKTVKLRSRVNVGPWNYLTGVFTSPHSLPRISWTHLSAI